MSDRALLAARRLLWSDCSNIRDLGGLASGDGEGSRAVRPGAMVRERAFVRADLLTHLDEEGWRALAEHGVRTIIDLRSPVEIEMHPYDIGEAARDAGVEVLALAMLPLDAEMMARLETSKSRGEEYVIFVETYKEPIAAILRAIIAAQPGGVLYHCHAGKDRTGIISALLLGLVGVPEDVIITDYAESQRLLWPAWEREAAAAAEAGEPEPVRPLTEPETMRDLLDHLHACYGGARGYMQAIGLTPGEIEALAARLD